MAQAPRIPLVRTARREVSVFARALASTLAVGILFALAASVLSARAYELHGFRWDGSTVGYEADPSLRGYADASAAQWQSVSGLRFVAGAQIRVVAGPLLPPIDHPGQPAQANVVQSGGVLRACEIRVDLQEFDALSEGARHAVMAHEFGHCVGINHSTRPGIMRNPMLYRFSDDDAEAARTLYGPPGAAVASRTELRYRVVAGGVAGSR